MKIHEILIESQLQEGPILNKISSAVGKGVGTLAKGVGAVAGGVAGLGSAVKKGFQAGKATVGGAGDDPAADPATTDKRNILQKVRDTMPGLNVKTDTTAGGTTQATQEPPAADTDGGTAQVPQQPPARKKSTSAFGKLSAAAAGQSTDDAPAANPKADTAYAQAQKAIAGLQPEQKKEIVTMLQADPKVKAAMTAKPKTTKPAADAGAGAMGAMAGQLAKGGAAEPNTMANAPVSATNTAKPGNLNAASAATQTAPEPAPAAEPAAEPVTTPVKQRTGGRVKGQLSQDPRAVKRREANAAKQKVKEPKKKPAAPDQATMDADRERIMGPTSDSIVRTRPMMAEGFSLFRKR